MSNPILPPSAPRCTPAEVRKALAALGESHADPIWLAVRGYRLRTMGDPARNDRGIYDDAIILWSGGTVLAWNANTDPSRIRMPANGVHGMAVLEPGRWLYKPGIHGLSKPAAQQYPAFVQAAPVTVRRDGGKVETGWFGINVHRGGETSTSSEGCQTVPPAMWPAFRMAALKAMEEGRTKEIPYRLITVDAWEAAIR